MSASEMFRPGLQLHTANINAYRRLIVADLAKAVFMQRDLCSQRIEQKGAETPTPAGARTHAHTPFFSSPSVSASFPSSLASAHSFCNQSSLPHPYLSLLIGQRSEVARSPLPPLPRPSFQKDLRHISEGPDCIMFAFGGTTTKRRAEAVALKSHLILGLEKKKM